MNRNRLLAYLMLLATVAIWGTAGPVIKFTLAGISALNFLTYRFAISAILSLASAPFGGLQLPKGKKVLGLTLLYGFLTSTVALGLLFLGLERTNALDLTFLAMVGPLLIVAAGELFFHERVTKLEKLGIMTALTGTVLIALEPILRNGIALQQLAGNFLIVLSLLAATASAVLVKDLMKLGVSAVSLTNLSFIIGFLTILPLTVFDGGLPHLISTVKSLSLPYQLGIIYMAIFSGSIAYTLWAKAQRTIEIGEAAIFSYLYPVFSAPLAVFWLKEKITTTFLVGVIIIAIGVFIAEYRSSRHRSVLS